MPPRCVIQRWVMYSRLWNPDADMRPLDSVHPELARTVARLPEESLQSLVHNLLLKTLPAFAHLPAVARCRANLVARQPLESADAQELVALSERLDSEYTALCEGGHAEPEYVPAFRAARYAYALALAAESSSAKNVHTVLYELAYSQPDPDRFLDDALNEARALSGFPGGHDEDAGASPHARRGETARERPPGAPRWQRWLTALSPGQHKGLKSATRPSTGWAAVHVYYDRRTILVLPIALADTPCTVSMPPRFRLPHDVSANELGTAILAGLASSVQGCSEVDLPRCERETREFAGVGDLNDLSPRCELATVTHRAGCSCATVKVRRQYREGGWISTKDDPSCEVRLDAQELGTAVRRVVDGPAPSPAGP